MSVRTQCGGQVRRDAGGDVGGEVDGHGQEAELDVLSEGANPGPVVAVHDADVVVGLAEPFGEEAAHLAVAADDEDGGTGADAAAAKGVQLADAGVAQHGPEEVLDVVGVQASLGGLGTAGGDEVFLAGGVEGGKIVLLLNLGDLLNDAESLGQEVHQLLVNRVNLVAERVEFGPVGQGLGGAGGRGRTTGLGVRFSHGRSAGRGLDWSSGAG